MESDRIIGSAKALGRFKKSDGYQALVELVEEWHTRLYESFMESLDPKDLLRLKIEAEVVHKILGLVDDRVVQGRHLAESMRQRLEAERSESEAASRAETMRRRERRQVRFGGAL